MTIGGQIQKAYDSGIIYWEVYKGGHRISNEVYYSIKISVYDNYRAVFKRKE